MTALTTEALADGLGLKPQTLRAASCRHSHYFGIRPAKSPNGRLLWPAEATERLITNTSQASRTAFVTEVAPCSK
jgi:hypothetical protein